MRSVHQDPASEGATIGGLIREQAARRPTAIAVMDGERACSFAELVEKAERIAAGLRSRGSGPGTLVGLWCPRGIEAVAAMLGVLLTGAAYLPLDEADPPTRRAAILADAGPRLLLTGKPWNEPSGSLPVVEVDELIADTGDAAEIPANGDDASESAAAYVMYTSGSTGAPKGVVVEHRSVVNLVREPLLGLGPGRTVAHVASQAFDASVFEIWGALCTGAATMILEPADLLEPDRLERALTQHGVDTMFVTTALFNYLAEQRPPCLRLLRTLVFGGERGSPRHAEAMLELLAEAPTRLLHAYGPTENTVFSTLCLLEAGRPYPDLPLGGPIAGVHTVLVDEDDKAIDGDGTGELLLAGAGLARGYLGAPELNRRKFTEFQDGGTTRRVYRTGDIFRREAGTLYFVERRDGLVKLRGHRIELGEVEAAVLSHPAVLEAVVIVTGEECGRQLTGFARTSEPVTERELRRHVGHRLPAYMTPTSFLVVPSFQLGPTGKIDKSALRALAEGRT